MVKLNTTVPIYMRVKIATYNIIIIIVFNEKLF